MRKQPQRQRVNGRTFAVGTHDKTPNGNGSDDLRPRIAAMAYSFYERRGRQDGHHLEDWLAAERMILSGTA